MNVHWVPAALQLTVSVPTFTPLDRSQPAAPTHSSYVPATVGKPGEATVVQRPMVQPQLLLPPADV